MARKEIKNYIHEGKKRFNNPPIGLVNKDTELKSYKTKYTYDPHLDPKLDWAEKIERSKAFSIDTVSLHTHECIDPYTIIKAIRKHNGEPPKQTLSLFKQNPLPLREAIEFYQHQHNWSNRLIAGDSLLVMNSLYEREGLGNKVQLVFIDPPYGIKYGSNFQPFTNKRDVKDGDDKDLSQEPETIRAFRDTWKLGIHSYLTYLRDRLLLAHDLLTQSGSCIVQIGDENLHLIRNLMDEVFGKDNFFSLITFRKTPPLGTSGLPGICDYLVWYAKDKEKMKFRKLYKERAFGEGTMYSYLEEPDGTRRKMTREEQDGNIPKNARHFRTIDLLSTGQTATCFYDFEFEGKTIKQSHKSWKTTKEGMQRLIWANRLSMSGKAKVPSYVLFFDDFPVHTLHNSWTDTQGATNPRYVVQTSEKVIQRCLLMCTDPGDLVFDPTCGSGTTAFVAEQWGRRWITCDTSRVAITLAKQRLMTATFDYYHLQYPENGVSSGFDYKTVPHVTLGSIANNPEIVEGMSREAIKEAIDCYASQETEETLYDKPKKDSSKVRVTGPFTVEAVPAPFVESPQDVLKRGKEATGVSTPSLAISRKKETTRQAEWREKLLSSGIRSKGGKKVLEFSRMEPLSCHTYLHADAYTHENKRVVLSFAPTYSPLGTLQVERALEEAQSLKPKPESVVFAAFQFDPEAARDIEEAKWTGVSLFKVYMDSDLLVEDLKKKPRGVSSFWLMGQPDVGIVREGDGKYRVEVRGFDYYETRAGGEVRLISGDKEDIAMWMLDTDYDGRSLFPSQVFFPLASDKHNWKRLGKTLKAEIEEECIEAYRGTISLPFEAGEYRRIAVKIVDNRGIESLRLLDLKQ